MIDSSNVEDICCTDIIKGAFCIVFKIRDIKSASFSLSSYGGEIPDSILSILATIEKQVDCQIVRSIDNKDDFLICISKKYF